MQNFEKTMILAKASTSEVYNALTQAIPHWWTMQFEGASSKVGDKFTIRFGDKVFKTMQVETLVPNQKVLWLVTDSLIDLPSLENNTERVGTKIIWEISEQEGATHLHLTHEGLNPKVRCYEVCEGGWHQFTMSLMGLLRNRFRKPV